MSTNIPPRGPWPNRIAVVGEAPGANEEAYHKPFVGSAGQELMSMLEEAGFDTKQLYFTNVFKIRPPANKVETFFTSKKDPRAVTNIPPCGAGKYLLMELRPHLELLVQELKFVNPDLVIALGKTAMWATIGLSEISKFRGVLHKGPHYMVLPTFHPSYILRQYNDRPIAVADFIKAKQFIDGEISAPKSDHIIHYNPSPKDLLEWTEICLKSEILAPDLETAHGHIRTVGFATSPHEAFVFPFWCPKMGNYWDDPKDEALAWQCVCKIMASPIRKVFQNGMYDIQYCYEYGIPVGGPIDDTMIMHHSLQPELPKSLGFMGSIYLNTESWKEMRTRGDREEKGEA